MDSSNYQNVINLAAQPDHRQKVFYLRQFDPLLRDIDPLGPHANRLEVPDPYGLAERAFEKVLEMVEDSVEGLLQVLNG
jgi:protein-tyrosine phosphatase